MLSKFFLSFKRFFRQRSDTMRTIITFITKECFQDTQNLTNSNRLMLILDEDQLNDVNDEYVIMEEDNEGDRWFNWKPDPIDADPRRRFFN